MNMEWISVKERLPENEEEVLVACADSVKVYGVCYSPKYKLFNSCDSYETREDAEKHAFKEVTHWMPFPPKPERSEV